MSIKSAIVTIPGKNSKKSDKVIVNQKVNYNKNTPVDRNQIITITEKRSHRATLISQTAYSDGTQSMVVEIFFT